LEKAKTIDIENKIIGCQVLEKRRELTAK
jgi:hypothetical protein